MTDPHADRDPELYEPPLPSWAISGCDEPRIASSSGNVRRIPDSPILLLVIGRGP
jgi:hypothetical protein